VPAAVARDSVAIARLVNPVTMDGKWTTPDEWSETSRVSMYLAQGPESTGYLRIKNNYQYLYLLIDFVSDTTPAAKQARGQPVHWCYDGVGVGIDMRSDEPKPRPVGDRDDFAVYLSLHVPADRAQVTEWVRCTSVRHAF